MNAVMPQLVLISWQKDNVIAVRLCARFPGWEIWAKNGHLVIDIGNAKGAYNSNSCVKLNF